MFALRRLVPSPMIFAPSSASSMSMSMCGSYIRSFADVAGAAAADEVVKKVVPVAAKETKNTKMSHKGVMEDTIIVASKRNLSQSPLKMKFLLTLIRNTWVPDALAQLKFTPKMLAPDVAKILRRATAVAKINHDAIPEELWVKEVLVNKGLSQKRLRIMGRGRMGIGYRRKSNVTIKVAKINFDKEISLAYNFSQKKQWIKRKEFSEEMKKKREGTLVAKFNPPPTYMF